jgi:ribosomal protein S6--L-glutamate ligase
MEDQPHSLPPGSDPVILSFHPCIEADINAIVAGRPPGSVEEALIKQADAIIVSQGVREDLYQLCNRFCHRVFPNYHLRFTHPGKIGDILLFRALGLPHPETHIFLNVADYCRHYPLEESCYPFPLPFVLKGNCGGEGQMVFRILDTDHFVRVLEQLAAMEKSGIQGFIVQQLIDHGGRDLRVVVLNDELFSYWRVQSDARKFLTNLCAGGAIDTSSDPILRRQAEELVRAFCQQTGVNLAGIDLIFDQKDTSAQPLLLEINYWFGRRFFGSSQAYYLRLGQAIQRWLAAFDPGWPQRIRWGD